MCGGVSKDGTDAVVRDASSPRVWRCFPKVELAFFSDFVLSTCVEVFPFAPDRNVPPPSPLHVCGGVSWGVSVMPDVVRSSPRVWRCFQLLGLPDLVHQVLSTCVEVFPCDAQCETAAHGPLHVCGGVSELHISYLNDKKSSPRVWRCF